MTTWELIRTMVQKGYTFEMGPHCEGSRGYWAGFFLEDPNAPECDECEQPLLTRYWADTGHAMTAHRAVVMAAKIALKKPVVVPPSEEFKL